MRQPKRKQNGFSIIETLVYLALFAILMSGAVIAAYDIYESSGQSSSQIMMQDEGNFLLAKIQWAMSDIKTVDSPLLGTSNSHLSVTTDDLTSPTITVESDALAHNIIMTRMGHSETLNNSNVTVTNLVFDYKNQNGIPAVISHFTLNGNSNAGKKVSQDFQMTSYIKNSQ